MEANTNKGKAAEFFDKVGKQIQEFFRKQVVSLKRNPSKIPMLFLLITSIIFTFNLYRISNAAIAASTKYVGLQVFILTLSCLLAIFSFINVKGKKGKAFIVFICIVYALLLLQLVLGILVVRDFAVAFDKEMLVQETQAQIERAANLKKCVSIMIAYIIFVALDIALVALQPVYHKQLQKIKTTPKGAEVYKTTEQVTAPLIDIDDEE